MIYCRWNNAKWHIGHTRRPGWPGARIDQIHVIEVVTELGPVLPVDRAVLDFSPSVIILRLSSSREKREIEINTPAKQSQTDRKL